MRRTVIQIIAATALSFLSVGCATTATSTHTPQRYVSDAELERAIQDAERSALARMTDSVDPETAQTARQISLAESR